MSKWRKFWSLGAADRRAVLRAACGLIYVRAWLLLLPLSRWQKLLLRTPRVSRRALLGADAALARVAQVVRAVDVASRHLPGMNRCLVRAIVAKRMLSRDRIAVDLKIGVAHDSARKLDAHAWLEWQGTVILGEMEGSGVHGHYTHLHTLDSHRPHGNPPR